MPATGTVPPLQSVGIWVELAACVDAPLSDRWAPATIFFADIGRDPVSRMEVAQAKGICVSCPVQSDCLDYALAVRQEHGVWGGTTGKERATILRRRGRIAS